MRKKLITSKYYLLLLIMVTALGFFMRFWKLGQYPVSLSLDEVVIAYDSYSLLKTEKDQHGVLLPLTFRSIGDFKSPVLPYLMIPAIAVTGLTEFGTRATIAFVGSFSVFLVYLLIEELFRQREEGWRKMVALATAFSLAISPWHIRFSRGTFEAVLALFFLLVGVWLFFRLKRVSPRYLWLSAVFFSLSAYSYHAERVTAPLLVLSLILIYRKELKVLGRSLRNFFLVGILVSLPLLYIIFGLQGQTRANNVFLARDVEIAYEFSHAGEKGGLTATFLDNKAVILTNFWLKRYLDYWDLSYFFIDGAGLSPSGQPGLGLLYFFEIVPAAIGFWFLFLKNPGQVDKKIRVFLISWFLLGPLAASLANNVQHPLRSLTWIPIPQLLVGLGAVFIGERVVRWQIGFKIFLIAGVSVLVFFNLIYFFDLYFIHYPISDSEFWQYGMKQQALYAWEHKNEYEEIVVDPKFGTEGPYNVGIPYAYYLFYGKYEPKKFQNSARRKEKTENSVDFENFTFRDIYWPEDRLSKNKLFIGSPWVLPSKDLKAGQILETIYFMNKVPAFLIVKSQGE